MITLVLTYPQIFLSLIALGLGGVWSLWRNEPHNYDGGLATLSCTVLAVIWVLFILCIWGWIT